MENSNFIYNKINKDIEEGKYNSEEITTRFPPEPNGYLHIGHVKAALLNYNVAQKYGGKFNLRFDDTNPTKESQEYEDAILKDLGWLGIIDDERIFHGSNYFDQMIDYGRELIENGVAYVDDQTLEEIKAGRGDLKNPGVNSPYRDRSVEENLELFEGMIRGDYKPGEKVLRAKIDMASSNLNMRDPVLFRILDTEESDYHIFPMYDFAHPIEDAIEGITHSLCTLEFEDHRPLYDWVLANLNEFKEKPPVQIEFARLNLSNTIIGKRFLKQLVDEGIIDGWDDPRLATVSGLRNRGYTPESLKAFCEEIGVSKSNSVVDKQMLEHFIRDDLKLKAKRLNVILDPVKVIIDNYPEDEVEWLEIETNVEVPEMGKHKLPFSKELYIERSDFMEEPPKKYFRLYPGNEVRLRGAYFIKCVDYVKDENGNIIEIHCTYDPETKSGSGFNKRKVKGTLHWVSSEDMVPITVNLYEDLITEDFNPEDLSTIRKDSKKTVTAYAEPEIKNIKPGENLQFVRNGYFYLQPESNEFNQTVSLKSSYKPKRN